MDVFERLPGDAAIGHVRYSTAGGNDVKNCQPIMVDYSRGSIAVAHNGNFINTRQLRDELEAKGAIFQSSMDSEVVLHRVLYCSSDRLCQLHRSLVFESHVTFVLEIQISIYQIAQLLT